MVVIVMRDVLFMDGFVMKMFFIVGGMFLCVGIVILLC